MWNQKESKKKGYELVSMNTWNLYPNFDSFFYQDLVLFLQEYGIGEDHFQRANEGPLLVGQLL